MNKRIQLLLLLLMACACLCGLFFISYTGQSRLLQSVARVRDAMTRLQLSQDFLTSILKAESAQRGYILTGGKLYLEPFHAAESEIPVALDRLGERYVADPLETRDLLRQLRLNTGAKMGELRTTIELYDRGGLAPALAVVQTDEGEKATARIRELVATLALREQQKIDQSSESWRHEVLLARWLAGAGSAITVILLTLAALLIARNLRMQETLNAQLHAQTTQLQRAVDERSAELSELAANLQNVAETEKSALARELHDELGGSLVGAKMDLSWLRKRLANADADLSARWDRLERALETGIDFKRRVVEQLRPTLLDNLGFNSAARWLVEETCDAANLKYTLELSDPEPALSNETAIALFRVLQEALTNIVKHAKARGVTVAVQVDETSNRIRVLIQDDGVGIPESRLKALGGHGLGSMRHRIRGIGGQFTVRAGTGGGTEITALAPLKNEAAAPASG